MCIDFKEYHQALLVLEKVRELKVLSVEDKQILSKVHLPADKLDIRKGNRSAQSK